MVWAHDATEAHVRKAETQITETCQHLADAEAAQRHSGRTHGSTGALVPDARREHSAHYLHHHRRGETNSSQIGPRLTRFGCLLVFP